MSHWSPVIRPCVTQDVRGSAGPVTRGHQPRPRDPGLADWESQGSPEPGSQDHSEDRGLSVTGERWGVAMGVVS